MPAFEFENADDYAAIGQDGTLHIAGLRDMRASDNTLKADNLSNMRLLLCGTAFRHDKAKMSWLADRSPDWRQTSSNSDVSCGRHRVNC